MSTSSSPATPPLLALPTELQLLIYQTAKQDGLLPAAIDAINFGRTCKELRQIRNMDPESYLVIETREAAQSFIRASVESSFQLSATIKSVRVGSEGAMRELMRLTPETRSQFWRSLKQIYYAGCSQTSFSEHIDRPRTGSGIPAGYQPGGEWEENRSISVDGTGWLKAKVFSSGSYMISHDAEHIQNPEQDQNQTAAEEQDQHLYTPRSVACWISFCSDNTNDQLSELEILSLKRTCAGLLVLFDPQPTTVTVTGCETLVDKQAFGEEIAARFGHSVYEVHSGADFFTVAMRVGT